MPAIADYLYSNFFSTAAIIAASMNVAVVLYFLLVPRRDAATRQLMHVYLFISLQNFGYVLASSIYHPLAAYHRWITIGAVLPGLMAMAQFFFYFPDERNRRVARVLAVFQWCIALIVNVVFIRTSLSAAARFHFDGHYWDFDLDPLSYAISLVIIAYIVIVIATGLWRTMVTSGPRRWHTASLLGCFMIITVIPGILNSLSRSGTLDRGLFQVFWNLSTVLGFFLTATVYINVTRNRNTVMATLAGITLVSFMVVILGLSYFTSRDSERAYDHIHRLETARLAIDRAYRPRDLQSLTTMTPGMITSHLPLEMSAEMANTLLYERLASIENPGFIDGFEALMATAPPEAAGYRAALLHLARGLPAGDRGARAALLRETERLSSYAGIHARRVSQLPAENFRDAARHDLTTNVAGLKTFTKPLLTWLEAAPDGTDLKQGLLARLAPMRAAGFRIYRTTSTGNHTVSCIHVDQAGGSVIEAAFSYTLYRRYISDSSSSLLYLYFALLGILALALPLFFLGTLIRPLRSLLQGVRRVKEGNLDVTVPVAMEDEIGYLTGAFNDMVASVRSARHEIYHINHYLKNIIDSMPSILVSVDAQGRITHWNLAAEKKTGVSEENARGRMLEEIIPTFEQYMERIRHAMTMRRPDRLEKISYGEEGVIHYADFLLYPLIADGVEGVVIRIDDITSRVRLEEMMIQTEKMMSVGGLAAGMAHEINNPLGGILMASQNILRRITPGLSANVEAANEISVDLDQVVRYIERRDILRMLNTIKIMGERASGIVNNMLNFSRRSESRMTETDLAELLSTTVELAASDYDLKKKYDFRHIEIKREFADDMPPVACVRVEIQQVLLNLLKNAAQAIQLKEYASGEQPRITLRLRRENKRIIMEVEDNGPGMPHEVRKRIFEPFFTTKETGVGTGLGLSVSYFIITDNHQGTITVDSHPGTGTRFTITIPVRSANELRPPGV